MYEDFKVISTYTRAQAIEDGTLVEVDPKLSKQARFKWPVAITSSVWDEYVEWTQEDTNKQTYQDTTGRLWDILTMLMFAIRSAESGSALKFKLHCVPRDGNAKRAKLIELIATVGPGDDAEPVITVMRKGEY